MKYIGGIILFCISACCGADSIGFGKVVAVKQYDFNATKVIKIYLSSDSTNVVESCEENGKVRGTITLAQHDEAAVNRMVSLATAAYMAGKKIRLHSESNSCEVDFVALQEAVF
ncbi:hypothetical protein P886_0261 [Alteromonadaceae bacterium 2753L.S.0a.02]|nr:hypothetical protein P886_0261 [Alteromonadaceae bacterium 2753L.S.0a.02]